MHDEMFMVLPIFYSYEWFDSMSCFLLHVSTDNRYHERQYGQYYVP